MTDKITDLPQDKITDYLQKIYHTPSNTLSKINCTDGETPIEIGKKQLCLFLHSKLTFLQENDLFIPPDEWVAENISYLDRGYFGLVFVRKLGRQKLAIKVMKINYEEDFVKEVTNQQQCQQISPKIYDYYMCRCQDSIIGIIVMDYLEGYVPDYKIGPILEEQYKWCLANPDFMCIFKNGLKTLRKNINSTIDTLVNDNNINIADFQTMINPNTFDVKVIDLGMSETIEDSEKETVANDLKSSFDYLFTPFE